MGVLYSKKRRLKVRENEKKDTKQILAASLKQLLGRIPMEKITVKDITDGAGVIRPTFYNHFSDKYELLEYIIREDLLKPVKPLLLNHMIMEGLTLLFSNLKNDRDFYINAVKIEGQNSFESIARQEVTKLLLEVMDEVSGGNHYRYVWLSRDIVAQFYAQSMCYVAITWIKRDFMIEPKELSEIYEYLTKSTMLDVLKEFS